MNVIRSSTVSVARDNERKKRTDHALARATNGVHVCGGGRVTRRYDFRVAMTCLQVFRFALLCGDEASQKAITERSRSLCVISRTESRTFSSVYSLSSLHRLESLHWILVIPASRKTRPPSVENERSSFGVYIEKKKHAHKLPIFNTLCQKRVWDSLDIFDKNAIII